MAHNAQRLYCEKIRQEHRHYFDNILVLDVGSLDINGNNRYLFTNSNYWGIDLIPGKNVDLVMPIHKYHTERKFDVIICTEMLEHDRYIYKSLSNMIELLSINGLLIITAATVGRPEHGTYKNNPMDSPATNDYYENVTLQMLIKGLSLNSYTFFDYEISVIKNGDIRFHGFKNNLI